MAIPFLGRRNITSREFIVNCISQGKDTLAGFTVERSGSGTALAWYEDVQVPYAPQFLAPVLGRLGAAGFRVGMRKLAKVTRMPETSAAGTAGG